MKHLSRNKHSIYFLPILFLSLGAISPTGFAAEVEWGYEGETGQEFWAELSPEFHLCGEGTQQSPVDIVAAMEYEDSPKVKLKYKKTPLVIKNNGHTIEVEYETGSMLKLDGEEYRLLQFHFHTPSEHTVDGGPFPMEAHLVHINSSGQLAVVGIFMEEGDENEFIQTIWDYMPIQEGEMLVENTDINVKHFLPDDDEAYFHYAGSLTTPPCSEGVKWFVLNESVEVSAAQIMQFKAIFPLNARPVQALNDRIIHISED